MEPLQREEAGRFDQRMYRWIREAKLPLEKCLAPAPEILAILFDAEWREENEVIWDPKNPCDGFRILLTGKAIVGTESPANSESPAIDLDMICGIPFLLITSPTRFFIGSGFVTEQLRRAGSEFHSLQCGDGDETPDETPLHVGAMALFGERFA